MTPNGKLDRKALPAPDTEAYATRGYEPPQGEIEDQAGGDLGRGAASWSGWAGNDNFFELGGHSLLAVRVVTRLRQAFGVEVAIRDLFAHPVLADLAGIIESAARARRFRRLCLQNGAGAFLCRLRSSGCGFWRRWRESARPITFRLAFA